MEPMRRTLAGSETDSRGTTLSLRGLGPDDAVALAGGLGTLPRREHFVRSYGCRLVRHPLILPPGAPRFRRRAS